MAGYIGSKASVVSSGVERKKTYSITGSTTSLTGLNYTVGKVHVYQNGVRLLDGTDYTATNGTSITLTVAAQSGDNVVVISQADFQVSGAVSTSGDTMTGDLSFGDNDKAKFGVGNDLQVYHDGSNSYIDDAGTGNLYLRASNAIIMQSSDGAETIASFHDDNLCRLYYDNSIKLATTATGIDVTGSSATDTGILVTNSRNGVGMTLRLDNTNNGPGKGSGIKWQSGGFETGTIITRSVGTAASGDAPGYMTFHTSNDGSEDLAERMRIDSSGNVGIGNTSSGYVFTSNEKRLSVGNGAIHAAIQIYSGVNQWGGLEFADDTTNGSGQGLIGYYHPLNYMQFNTGGSERMRIDSSGALILSPAVSANPKLIQNCSNNTTAISFRSAGVQRGSIYFLDSGVSFNTTSDYRLKENVVGLTGASARVNQLNPSRFNFIADGTDTVVDGFLAHEVADVVPEAISGTKDAMMDEEYEVTPAVLDEDGNVTTEAVMGTRSVPDYQGIDQSKLVPLLTAALQEALTEIASLKTRVEALEA